MTTKLAQLLFAPRTIALIGASGDPKKYTSRPQRFLRQYKYPGKIIPVNPGRDEVLGEKAWPSVLDVPGEVDHAFIMVPTDAVEAALVQCVEKKVPVVTIYSDGFAETGAAGRVKQEKLLAIARKGNVRLIGPNCIGLFSSNPPCALSVNAAKTWLTSSMPEAWLYVLGATFVLVTLFLPRGLAGLALRARGGRDG